MLKNFAKRSLQKLLGFHNYLVLFSLFTIRRLKWGMHEKEFSFFVKMIPNEGILLDIGANIGAMTVFLAEKLPNTIVYAFEPMPDNIRAFKKVISIAKVKNVELFEIAVGDKTGELKMIMPIVNQVKMQGLSHVFEEGNNTSRSSGEIFEVPIIRLDELGQVTACDKIAAIKMDVEDFEYYVLKGALGLIKKHKPIIYCELWANEKRTLVLNFMNEMGYETKIFDGKKLIEYSGQDSTNFFLLPKL